MYCPNCSQQQVSDEMRFCSRCGFSLSVMRELIANGGVLAEPVTRAQSEQLAKSLRGMRRATWLMLAGVPLTLVTGLLAALEDDFAVLLLLPFLCFVVGFARLLYTVFWEGRTSRVKGDTLQPQATSLHPSQLGTTMRSPELSPQGAPIESFPDQRMRTAEMVQPRSVTENTTRLLDEEADSLGA
jgi:hypothetical protein